MKPGEFGISEHLADPSQAIAYAAKHGKAIVVNSDGKPVVIITIPTEDLPVLES